MGSIHNTIESYKNEIFKSETFKIEIPGAELDARVLCRWKFSKPVADGKASPYFNCIDLAIIVVPIPSTNGSNKNNETRSSIPEVTGTLLENIIHASPRFGTPVKEVEIGAKALLLPRPGFLCRSDIIELRMQDCEFVDSIIRFSKSDGYLSPSTNEAEHRILDLLSLSPGALLLKDSSVPMYEMLNLLQEDLNIRLSFNWSLPDRPAAKRLAMIGGRPKFDISKGSYGHEGSFQAAQALNISLLIVDHPGHWLEDDQYAHLREGFIAIDVTDDDELPVRIAKALESEEIDGIVTLSDEFVIATAKAATLLKLPTEPVPSFLQAHNKYEARKLLSPNIQSLRLQSGRGLNDPLMVEELRALQYPCIVKPCRGGGSRGVKKASNYPSLCSAITQLEETGQAKHGLLLETYIDGPEVDANFVLWDGEVLFFEISDDFPCTADATSATSSDNFAETVMVLPSQLDREEVENIRSSLHESLLRLGFRSGVFHLEARVQNSSMHYTDAEGITDLARTGTTSQTQPDVFLIEVNARPPGLQSVFATTYTYGVEYCGLQLLRALGDSDRYAALSKPFSCHAQYWCEIVFIPIHRDNIVIPDDFCGRVIDQLPDIAPHVSKAERTTFKKIVSPVGGTGFIGYFLLYSRSSRRQVIEMGDRIRKVSKEILDNN